MSGRCRYGMVQIGRSQRGNLGAMHDKSGRMISDLALQYLELIRVLSLGVGLRLAVIQGIDPKRWEGARLEQGLNTYGDAGAPKAAGPTN